MKLTNYHWSLLANLSQSVFAWLVLLTMVKTGNQKDVGVYTYIQSIVLPIQLFFTLKLRTLQNSDFNDEVSYFEYHRIRVVTSVLNISLVIAFILFFGVEQKAVYVVMALTYSLYILRESYVSLVQKINRNDVYFKMNIVSGTASFLIFFMCYIYTKDMFSSLLISFISRAFVYYFYEKELVRPFIHNLTKTQRGSVVYKKVIRDGLPLAVTALVGALFTSIPRIIIEKELGINELAIYGALSSLLFFINILVNSFVQSSLPDFAKLYKKSIAEFIRIFMSIIVKLLLISGFCFVFVYLFGEFFLKVVFTKEYSYYTKELTLIFISGVSLSLFSIGNLLLSSQRSFRVQLPIYILVAVSIFISSKFLIPEIGMKGAIISQIISYIFGFFLCLFYFNTRCFNAEYIKER